MDLSGLVIDRIRMEQQQFTAPLSYTPGNTHYTSVNNALGTENKDAAGPILQLRSFRVPCQPSSRKTSDHSPNR
ncbi:unnamed protein product [Clonostachys rosea f. rosea IK726]|uniref:Uncharacterized protein n=2 Tax=Bionectria ochroleuca TaxID=29856 RepID=A0ACA9THQ4_BIOOC|nr:unnamed protein product [Clonostachys rosea f. rosea IK726]